MTINIVKSTKNVARDELIHYCDTLLDIHSFKDYAPNGLQIEGKRHIRHIVAGVTASQALLEVALDQGADAVLVHHGYFWRSEPATIVGMRKRRIQTLLANDINLIAYHLPLDAHMELGNNIQLAKILDITFEAVVKKGATKNLLCHGTLTTPESINTFTQRLHRQLQHEPLVIDAGTHPIKRVAWCTGAAQHFIHEAADLGVDAFISGEISESTTHSAREMGIHYFAAGHHATERCGIKALGEHLVEKFGVSCTFVDIPNPV